MAAVPESAVPEAGKPAAVPGQALAVPLGQALAAEALPAAPEVTRGKVLAAEANLRMAEIWMERNPTNEQCKASSADAPGMRPFPR